MLSTVVVVVLMIGSWAHAAPAHAEVTFNSKMLELVNQQRALVGVAPLQMSAPLASVAEDGQYNGCGFAVQGRAKDMGTRNYFSHTIAGCGTQGVFNMLGSAGITYGAAGENIAWMNGTTDPLIAAQRLTNDLMASPSHKANILNPDFTNIGIGSWTSAAGQSWTGGGSALTRVWIATQVFAKMGSTSPVPVSTPAVSISPSSLAFGDGTVGILTASQTATVKNTGNAPLTISGIALSGANPGDFSIASNTCGTVAAGNSCTLGVAFKPTVVGARSATLTVTDNAAGSPHGVSLTGGGVVPVSPGAPTNVKATPGDGAMSATWTLPTGSGVDGFAVYIYDATDQYSGHWAWVCPTCTSGTVTGLANGQSYYAVVYSHYAFGWAGLNRSANVVVGTPVAPRNVVAVAGNGQATASWSSVTGTGVDLYGVYAYDSNGYAYLYTVPCGTCASGTLTGMVNGRSYRIAVFAHTAWGWSEPTYTNWFTPTA